MLLGAVLAAGALAQCRKEGQKVSVTVVDAAGRPKAMVRDDGVAPRGGEGDAKCAEAGIARVAKDLSASR